jgi:hypothetical protein
MNEKNLKIVQLYFKRLCDVMPLLISYICLFVVCACVHPVHLVVTCVPMNPRITGPNLAEVDGLLKAVKMHSTISFTYMARKRTFCSKEKESSVPHTAPCSAPSCCCGHMTARSV